jgi:DNA-binding winged helix-turn-helix (wHTH) protein
VRIVFGDCVFDRERRELVYRGSVVHAVPKVLRLLELLIDARPRALSKDDIHKALWNETFVSDATLTSLVAELRAAIGDDARAPHLIRTLHGYGYLFCGGVSNAAQPAASLAERRLPVYRVVLGDREIALGPGRHVLGREDTAAIFVDDAGVSRQHARISIDEHGAMLEDLGSKNGTTLDGRPIDRPTVLHDGAMLVVGATAIKFRVFETHGSTETVSRQ